MTYAEYTSSGGMGSADLFNIYLGVVLVFLYSGSEFIACLLLVCRLGS